MQLPRNWICEACEASGHSRGGKQVRRWWSITISPCSQGLYRGLLPHNEAMSHAKICTCLYERLSVILIQSLPFVICDDNSLLLIHKIPWCFILTSSDFFMSYLQEAMQIIEIDVWSWIIMSQDWKREKKKGGWLILSPLLRAKRAFLSVRAEDLNKQSQTFWCKEKITAKCKTLDSFWKFC
jgi:hypothetical protein